MRRIVATSLPAVLALIAVAWAGSALAGEGIDIRPASQGRPHDYIFGLSFEGRQGLAVGDHGLLLATADGGGVWETIASPAPQAALFAVARVAGKCLAGGQEGSIVRSDDCVRWEVVPPVTEARILGIHVNTHGIGYAVGGFGTILKTSDWGKTWTPLRLDWQALLGGDAEPHLYAVHVGEDGVVTLAGEFELIARSTDGGGHWEALHKGTRSLFGLSVGAGGRLFAAGQEGLILKSADNGKTWSSAPSGSNAILTGIWAAEDGLAVVAVGIRTILVSRDGGASFVADASFASAHDVHSAVQGTVEQGRERVVFIAGAHGEILRLSF